MLKKLKDKLVNKFTGKEKPDDIVASIQGKLRNVLDDTRTTRRQWLINAAFARSQQWTILRRTEDRLVNLAAPPGRKHVTDDMIRPAKKHFIANMVVATPQFKAVPENLQDSKAITAARFGSSLLSHYWDSWKFVLDYINLLVYIYDFGNAYIYVNVEPVQKTFGSVDTMTGDPALDADEEPIVSQEAIMDITETVLPPHNVVCPQDRSPLKDKPWIIIYQLRDLDYFKETYENGDEVQAEKIFYREEYDLYLISQLDNQDRKLRRESANEIIYMQKPSPGNEDGIICVIAGNVLLKRKGDKKAINPWPYKKLTSYPLVHFHGVQESDEFLARSDIEMVIPLQKSLNLLLSSMVENAEDMCHIKWLIHSSALQAYEDITDIPDILRWSGSVPPEQAKPAALPEYIFRLVDILKASIRDKQNYHTASAGGVAGSMRSQVQQVNSQEQDLLPMTVQDEINTIKFEELGEIVLKIAAEMLPEERLITYTGEDNRLMVEKFKGVMLGDTTKVRVKLKNMHLRNKSAVISNIINMFQYGMIIDEFGQPDGMRAMELLEWAIPDSEFDDMKMQSERAHLENDKLMLGEFVPVLPFQNHKVDLNIHYREMNGPEYMRMFDGAKMIKTDQTNPKTGQPVTKIQYTDQAYESIIQNFMEHSQAHLTIYMQNLARLQPPPEEQDGQTQTKQKPKPKANSK